MRNTLRIVVAVLALGILSGAASGTAAMAIEPTGGARSAPAGVDDFAFTSFDADYYLARDAGGRSQLRTVETLVAQFPEADQNRGIRRAIPLAYDGHPTGVEVESVVDDRGRAREFSTADSDDGEFLLVTIAADGFVHGLQTYVLTTVQHNVTRYFGDTGVDEFYWDTNGTGWNQPFGSVTARVHVPEALAGSLEGGAACYYGVEGSTTQCPISEAPGRSGETVFSATEQNLGPRENLSVAIAFEKGTFVPRDDSFLGSWQAIIGLVFAVLAVLVAMGAIAYRLTRLKDAPGRPTIVAEYAPPPGANIFASAVVMRAGARAAAAEFVSFAVRGVVQIVERPSLSRWSSKPVYWLRLLDTRALDPQERAFAQLLFGPQLVAGSWRELKSSDTGLAKGIYAFMQDVRERSFVDGLRATGRTGVGVLLAVLAALAAVGTAVFSIAALDDARGGLAPLLLIALAVLSVMVTVLVAFRIPLTAAGAELRDHVKGVRLYIQVAEEERYRMLQSAGGALTTGIDVSDGAQVVKLYEKLLPYAVLLGLEKSWAEVLGQRYERAGGQPEWYQGSAAFNAVYFAASVGSFAASASSYSGSASSSSSGGSSGGGSSGGGGGGGGGGGV